MQAAMNAQSKDWGEMYLRDQLGDEGYKKYRAWEKQQSILLVIFRLRRSDIFCCAKCDIETCGFSDIIFAPNAHRHITRRQPNITAKQYHSPKANITENDKFLSKLVVFWWGRTDSNHRSDTQQIYSLSPLATRELPHIKFESD